MPNNQYIALACFDDNTLTDKSTTATQPQPPPSPGHASSFDTDEDETEREDKATVRMGETGSLENFASWGTNLENCGDEGDSTREGSTVATTSTRVLGEQADAEEACGTSLQERKFEAASKDADVDEGKTEDTGKEYDFEEKNRTK